MFYRSGWLRCVGLKYVVFGLSVWHLSWCLKIDIRCLCYIVYYYYTYTIIILLYIIYYTILIISYLILYSSFFLSLSVLPFPLIFFPSNPFLPFSLPILLIPRILVGTWISLFIYSSAPPLPQSDLSSIPSSLPIIPFKVYVSALTYGYLYSISIQ